MSWQNSPVLNKLTASQQGGNCGAQLWGVDVKGTLYTIYQTTPGGGQWSKWLGPDWAGPNHPKQTIFNYQTAPGRNDWWGWSAGDFEDKMEAYEVTAAGQNNGCAEVWVISNKQVLHSQVVRSDSKIGNVSGRLLYKFSIWWGSVSR